MSTTYVPNVEQGNVSLIDRMFRFTLGMVLIVSGIVLANAESTVWIYEILFGCVVSLTGIAGWDPLYATFSSMFKRKRSAATTRAALNAA